MGECKSMYNVKGSRAGGGTGFSGGGFPPASVSGAGGMSSVVLTADIFDNDGLER